MDLRNRVKNLLRMCGHAVVSTVHERLDGIERMLQHIQGQNTHIAEMQTAILQSGVHLVENMARMQAGAGTQETAIAKALSELGALLEQSTHIAEMQTPILQSGVHLVESAARMQAAAKAQEAGYATILSELRTLQAAPETAMATAVSELRTLVDLNSATRQAASAILPAMEPLLRQTSEFLTNQAVRQVCVETSDYASTNPELGLVAFLYSYLPSRIALDVGAHIGDFSEHLLNAGYEVYAFEPQPDSYRRLTERLARRAEFRPFNMGLGNKAGEQLLYAVHDDSAEKRYEDPTVFYSLTPHGMPADLRFDGASPVRVGRLGELHREGLVPAEASLVKIDTEGYDLEVIRGMEEYRYPVVMVEFWDENIPFATQGLLYTAASMAREMQQRGYLWYIAIYRVWGRNETAFFCNHDRPVPGSWGNIVFFRDREIFSQARDWCAAVLPQTYFKHVAAPASLP
jgi:FkbM family methyltransferase